MSLPALVLLVLPLVAEAQALQPGAVFQVNSSSGALRKNQDLCRSSAGDFVVVWESFPGIGQTGQDGSLEGIYARRFTKDGQALGPEFQVNTYTTGPQSYPSLACEDDGDFVIVWTSRFTDQDGDLSGVFGQRYDRNGARRGGEFQVNTSTVHDQFGGPVVAEPGGGFLVVWTSWSRDGFQNKLLAQSYDAAGRRKGGEIVLYGPVQGYVQALALATDKAGRYFVIWAEDGAPPWGIDLFGLIFRRGGEPVTEKFLLKSYVYTGPYGIRPDIVWNDAGRFLATWQKDEPTNFQFSRDDVLGRLYERDGTPVGGEFQVNAYTTGEQFSSAVTADSAGNFVVAWLDVGFCAESDDLGCTRRVPSPTGAPSGVFGQRLGSDGGSIGPMFAASTYSPDGQGVPAVSADSAGGFTVVWSDAVPTQGLDWPLLGLNFQDPAVPGEFQVNSTTASDQRYPAIGCSSAGGFVVAWQSLGQDGSGEGIAAQPFDDAGVPVGSELLVNATAASDQRDPAAGADAQGNFVVLWQSEGQDGSGSGVYGRRYAASGAPRGGEFRVNARTAGSQTLPALAVHEGGSFWAAWQSEGQDGAGTAVVLRRYAASGRPLGGEVRVNTATAGDQQRPALCLDPAGNAVVVWEGPDRDETGIYAQRYDRTGRRLGGELRVNTVVRGAQSHPAVACRADGEFAVAWRSSAADPDRSASVFLRRFDASGRPKGRESRVNTTKPGDQGYAALAYDSAGRLTVVWESFGQDGDRAGLFSRRYERSGEPLSGELRVSRTTLASQGEPAVCSAGDAGALAVWQDGAFGGSGQDGSGWGVVGRRIGPTP